MTAKPARQADPKQPTVVLWQRGVPVYGIPIFTRPFAILAAIAALGISLSVYREIAGLGPASGMNDAYVWGIWKTFNVMVLTGLGSGGFAVGIAAWIFFRRNLHAVMRTALLTSFIAYLTGLIGLLVDVGRPWNFYWAIMPWKWNGHSPMLEIAICMPLYAFFPLLLENIPPVLETMYYKYKASRPIIDNRIMPVIRVTYPWVVAFAYALPMMHQSSLGALMLLGGTKVNALWQTPMLPYLYVSAAAYLGFACVIITLIMCCMFWKRPFDKVIMGELADIMSKFTLGWVAVRFVDIVVRGALPLAFQPTRFAALFWLENALLILPNVLLLNRARRENIDLLFKWTIPVALGGMLYRFDPTTLAYSPQPGAYYFPSFVEILISLGWISVATMIFLAMVKKTAILPAPIENWYKLERYQQALKPEVKLTGYVTSHSH
jgi:Ni/Fe-hydrogenase subunit HybB-like protein